MTSVSTTFYLPAVSAERGLSHYLAAIRQFPMLAAEEEAALARCWREQGDRKAAYRLVTSHLRLAAKIALRYRGYGLPLADLISEANVGLMSAVQRFEPDKGFRLSTYAMWWIKAAVQEFVLKSWSLVKIGRTSAQKKLFFNLRKMKARLSPHDNENLSPEQIDYIAKQLQVGPRDVVEMNGRMRGDVSLNGSAVQQDSDETMQDWLADPSPDPESQLSEIEDHARRRAALNKALAGLKDRERSIIYSRFLDETPKTLEELAQTFGISRERIRQIEHRALQKIKSAVEADVKGPATSASRFHALSKVCRSNLAAAN